MASSPETLDQARQVQALRSLGWSYPAVARRLGIKTRRAQWLGAYYRDLPPSEPSASQLRAIRHARALGRAPSDIALETGLALGLVSAALAGAFGDLGR